MTLDLTEAVSVLEGGVARGDLLGSQIAVVERGDLVLDRAVGARDLDGAPLSHQDRVPWYCASKTPLVIAALHLLNQEGIPLDLPVSALLPGFSEGGKEAVELRHLMNHTAGFRLPVGLQDPLWHGYDEMLSASLDAPLETGWLPGSDGGYHYWTAHYVLSAILEELSGKPYEDLVDDLALRPAGTRDVLHGRHTGAVWAAPDTVVGHQRLWSGHLRERVFLRHGAMSACPGNDTIGPISGLALVLDYVRGNLADEADNRAGAVARAAVGRSWGGPDRTFFSVMDYGLGLMRNMRRSGYGHTLPADTFGHPGYDSSVGISIPELELSIGLFLDGGLTSGVRFRCPALAAPVVDAVVSAARAAANRGDG